MSDDKSKDSKPAVDEGAALKKLQAELAAEKQAVASLKGDLASARETLAAAEATLREKDERILDLKVMVDTLKSMPAASPAGAAVMTTLQDATEAARASDRKSKLHEMRAKAQEVAGPRAQFVKYIVGPSGTVRPEEGVVKPGKVIDVPRDELPSGEWKVWTPEDFEAAAPKAPETAREIQARNRPPGMSSAAEKAIAQREALKSQLREG